MFHREDYYYAEMIAWLKRAVVRNPGSVRAKDCMIRFTSDVSAERKPTWKEKAASAKNFFTNLLAFKKAETAIKEKKPILRGKRK